MGDSKGMKRKLKYKRFQKGGKGTVTGAAFS